MILCNVLAQRITRRKTRPYCTCGGSWTSWRAQQGSLSPRAPDPRPRRTRTHVPGRPGPTRRASRRRRRRPMGRPEGARARRSRQCRRSRRASTWLRSTGRRSSPSSTTSSPSPTSHHPFTVSPTFSFASV